MSPNEIEYLIKWEFLKSEIADFFMKEAKSFMLTVYESYKEKFPNNYFVNKDIDEIKSLVIKS